MADPRRAAGDRSPDAGPADDPVAAVSAHLRRVGRAHEVRTDAGLLVLGSGVAQRLDDVSFAYAGARAAGASPDQAAEHVVGTLAAQEQRLDREAAQGRVRLRITHPRELDPEHTLPGPAGLIVYPVLDGTRAATRLGPEQTGLRGGLEQVCVAALGPTLAEPVRVESGAVGELAAWRVTGDIYTASRVLGTGGLLAELGADPARPHLVGVPSSREVWVLIERGGAPHDLDTARQHVAARFAESMGRISPALYRWDGDRLVELSD